MRNAGNFVRSVIPFLLALILEVVALAAVLVVFLIRPSGGGSISEILASAPFTQAANICYAILALIFFGVWYQKVFVRPFSKKRRNYPGGFSFHTICALIFMAFGLQYVCTLVVDSVAKIHPAWLDNYTRMLDTSGYGDLPLTLILYTVILAPIAEELLFRGLIFRYARYALPFWAANLWQALLFGVIHLNILQGVYAFAAGLFFGFICHRGHGIRYSIPLHIGFNALGCFLNGLISFTTSASYPIFIGLGILLTAFAVWLFYTEFPSPSRERNTAKEA